MEIRRRTSKTKGQGGFTLMEMVVAMAVSMILLTAGTALYVTSMKEAVTSHAFATANATGQLVMEYINKDVKQAVEIPSSATIPQGTFTSDYKTLVLKLPAWNAATSETVSNKFDIVVYQYITLQNDAGGVSHKVYNIRRIVSPDASSSRTGEDRWMLPHDVNRDAGNPSLYRSEPYAGYVTGYTNKMFKYLVQDGTTGAVLEKTALHGWDDVLLVESRISVNKTHSQGPIKADVATRTRLRNWEPSP